MIWATVSSKSCFCWLYTVSPSSAAKNVISLISVLTIWWSPYVSYLVGRGCWLWSVRSLDKILLAFALLHLVLQGHLPFFFFGVSSKSSYKLHRTSHLQPSWHQWSGHRLRVLWWWVVCLGNKPRSFCHFWDCTQVLHFSLLCWLWGLFHFF